MPARSAASTFDQYIAGFPHETCEVLKQTLALLGPTAAGHHALIRVGTTTCRSASVRRVAVLPVRPRASASAPSSTGTDGSRVSAMTGEAETCR